MTIVMSSTDHFWPVTISVIWCSIKHHSPLSWYENVPYARYALQYSYCMLVHPHPYPHSNCREGGRATGTTAWSGERKTTVCHWQEAPLICLFWWLLKVSTNFQLLNDCFVSQHRLGASKRWGAGDGNVFIARWRGREGEGVGSSLSWQAS